MQVEILMFGPYETSEFQLLWNINKHFGILAYPGQLSRRWWGLGGGSFAVATITIAGRLYWAFKLLTLSARGAGIRSSLMFPFPTQKVCDSRKCFLLPFRCLDRWGKVPTYHILYSCNWIGRAGGGAGGGFGLKLTLIAPALRTGSPESVLQFTHHVLHMMLHGYWIYKTQ